MRNNSKMIVTYPVLQGNGNKYTATNLADAIKTKHPELSVALIDFDFKAPYLAGYVSGHDKVHTIDNLIERIDGNLLNEENIKMNMVVLPNEVELLKGTKLRNVDSYIDQEHIRKLVFMLKEMYDILVVAVSNGQDSLNTMAALLLADEILLVGRNDYSNYVTLEREIRFVQNYASNENQIKMIFNMYDAHSDLNFQSILSDCNIPLIGTVPYNPDTVNNKQIDDGKLIEKFFKSKKNESPYENVVDSLLPDYREK